MTRSNLPAVRERAELLRSKGKTLGEVWVTVAAKDMDDMADEIEAHRERKGYASKRLDLAREAAEALLAKEQNHSGSGRNGHLSEDDLVPLFEALGAIYLDDPNMQILVDPDGE